MTRSTKWSAISALQKRIRNLHVNHRRIAWGMTSVGLLLILVKLLSAAKEAAVAWKYGVSPTVDAYLLALTIVTWLPTTLVSVGTVVLVPRLVALAANPVERDRFVAEANGTALLVGTLLSLCMALAVPQIVAFMTPVQSETQSITQHLVVQMIPLVLLTIYVGIFSIRLQARGRFGYSLLEAGPALGIVALVLIWSPDPLGTPLVIGTVAGTVVQIGALAWMLKKGDTPVWRIALRHTSPQWRGLYRGAAMMVFGQFIISFTLPIDQFYAARIEEGAVSTLGYANRFISLATTLGAVTIARALLPVLSEAASKGECAAGRRQALRWSWLMFALGCLSAAVGWLLAPWAVSLLFERGAFSSTDTANVSIVLRYSLLQLPFYFAGTALLQHFAASRNYTPLLTAAAVTVLVRWLLDDLLSARYGVAGIAMATAASIASWWLMQFCMSTRIVRERTACRR